MKRTLRIVGGLAISALLVWLLFRNTKGADLWAATTRASMPWLLLAGALIVLSSFVRAQRWSYIVRTAKPVRYRYIFSAAQIGILANLAIPARLGELIQAMALSRLARLPFSRAVAMTALDRLLDLLSMVAAIAMTLGVFKPVDCIIPKETFGWQIVFSAGQVREGECLSGAILAVMGGLLVLLYLRQARALWLVDRGLGWFSRRFATRMRGFLQDFVDGLRIFHNALDMLKSVAYSLLTWTICTLAFEAMLRAFHVSGPWYTPIVAVTFLAITISIPGAPGLIGQFQAPVVVALVMLTSADDATAKALAIVAHIIDVFPALVMGLICLYMERFSMTRLKEDTVIAEQEIARGTAGN
jgi:hypothetical protein